MSYRIAFIECKLLRLSLVLDCVGVHVVCAVLLAEVVDAAAVLAELRVAVLALEVCVLCECAFSAYTEVICIFCRSVDPKIMGYRRSVMLSPWILISLIVLIYYCIIRTHCDVGDLE